MSQELTKKCSWCLKVKPITEFSFRGFNKKTKKHERRNFCKDCCKLKKKHKNVYRVDDLERPIPLNKDGVILVRTSPTYGEIMRDYENENLIKRLSDIILKIVRYDYSRLSALTKEEFETKTSYKGSDELYQKVVSYATSQLCDKGRLETSSFTFDEDGVYLVIGDSFGKHCKTKMFDLLKALDTCTCFDGYTSFNKVIHLGHALDDDGELSYNWKYFKDRLIFVGKPEELETLHKNKNDYQFSIVQDFVKVGNVICRNQEQISPYSKQSINTLDQYVYKENTIVNLTRHEYFQKNSFGDVFIASTGTLAEPFVAETIKQLDFTDGYKVKECYSNTFSKYRRMKENLAYWQNGCYIIKVKGRITDVTPVRIKKFKGNYCVCVNNEIILSDGTKCKPDETYAVIADAHLPKISIEAFAIALSKLTGNERGIIFLGDLLDGRGVNPHILSRGETLDSDICTEYRYLSNFLKEFSNKYKKILLKGNHECFYDRFAKKFPSLCILFENIEQSIYKDAGVNIYRNNANAPYIYKDVTFVHGSDKMVGQSGRDVYDKIAKTFNTSTKVMGHTHRPAIFRDVYSVGCLASEDQEYNSTYTSNWKNGMAFVHYYNNIPFVELVNFNGCSPVDTKVNKLYNRVIDRFLTKRVQIPFCLNPF